MPSVLARLRERLAEIRADFAPYDIHEMFFQPDKVAERLNNLAWSLVLSVLIIVAVVFTGMGIRMGLLVASILPMVALISVGLYDLGGGVLHQIAVIGMVISLGILIDNAIVIVENIQGHLDEGMRRLDALRRAVSDWPGHWRLDWYHPGRFRAPADGQGRYGGLHPRRTGDDHADPVGQLSVGDLGGALLAARFLKRSGSGHRDRLIGLARFLGRLVQRYPGRLILAGLVLVAISVGMTPFMAQQFFPNADRPRVIVELHMPEGTDQARTGQAASELEHALRQRPDVLDVHRFVGFSGPSFYYNLRRSPDAPNLARLVVRTPTLEDTTDLMHWIRERVARNLPDLTIDVGILGRGPVRKAPVEVRVFNADDARRATAVRQVYRLLRCWAPWTYDTTWISACRYAINVDDATAARYGLTRADVTAFTGRASGLCGAFPPGR